MIVVNAGAAQKPGETRLDLVTKNISIFGSIIPQIRESGFNGILLIVSNPVDVLTYAAIKMSGLPEGQVIGSGTVLDTARLKYMLGEHLDVDPRDVHAYIVGEHGDSEVAAWSSATVAGVPLSTYCELHGHYNHEESERRIADEVKNSAYEIIEKKRATYYGIAMSVRRICTAIMRDEDCVLPVSSLMVGEYGLNDLCISVPTVVGRNGVVTRVPVSLSEEENAEFQVLPVSSLMVGEYGLNDLCISVPTVVGRNGVVTRVPVSLSEEENAEFQKSAAALKAIVDEAGLND